MAKDKKKKQSTMYFNIRIENEFRDNAEDKVNAHMQSGGTSIYTFYDTYVYVPLDNKIKEKDFKKVEEALQNHDFKVLPLRPVIYEETTTKQSLYTCFPKKDTSIGNHSWLYLSVLDYIRLVESLDETYDIALILSNTNIIIPRILWSELKLLYNEPIVTIPTKEKEDMIVDGKYQLINIEDELNMDFFKALMEYKKAPSETIYDRMISLLDESNTTVYMPIDMVLKDSSIEQFKTDLVNLNYTTTLSKTIFDSLMGKVCLVYTSKRYIPEALKEAYTWVSLNFMDAYRILSQNKDFGCILFNYLNNGFKASREGLDALYYESFALGQAVNTDDISLLPIVKVLDEFNVEEAYLYEAYNRIGNAILYTGNVEANQIKQRLDQLLPENNLFVNKMDQYEIINKGEPFYKR